MFVVYFLPTTPLCVVKILLGNPPEYTYIGRQLSLRHHETGTVELLELSFSSFWMRMHRGTSRLNSQLPV